MTYVDKVLQALYYYEESFPNRFFSAEDIADHANIDVYAAKDTLRKLFKKQLIARQKIRQTFAYKILPAGIRFMRREKKIIEVS